MHKVYDLPDLTAAMAPRPLTICNPVDAAGRQLTKEVAEECYKGSFARPTKRPRQRIGS